MSYDSLGRLTNVHDTVISGGANISQFTYGYDNRDVQTGVQRALGTASAQTVNYTYDNIGQLIGETSTETTPLVDNSYTYDDAGNRLTSSTDGTESTFTLDQMNQITGYTLGGNAVTVQYDANGNTTQLGFQSMTYDDADRLTSVIQKNPLTDINVKKTEYVYDGLSRRRKSITYTWNAGNQTWTQQSERRFIYDGMDLIQERDGSNNVIASYVRDGNIGGVLSRTTSSGTFYYHYDGNGNVVAMTNTAGSTVAQYTYDAYGNLTAMSGAQAASNPIRFSTKYFDSNTGYYDFGFRFYDPTTGRWLNRDPIGESGGLNLYGFVGNSPGNAVDGYGLDPTDPYGQQVLDVFKGYGDTLNPYNWYLGTKHIYDVGKNCGLGAAGKTFALGTYHGLTDWVTTSDARHFGQSFGTTLMTLAPAISKIPSPKGLSLGLEGEATVTVSRWGRPGLESGDWVMKGKANFWNYLKSGKYDPNPTNEYAPFSSGEQFTVPKTSLHKPKGPVGLLKSLLGQRIYKK